MCCSFIELNLRTMTNEIMSFDSSFLIGHWTFAENRLKSTLPNFVLSKIGFEYYELFTLMECPVYCSYVKNVKLVWKQQKAREKPNIYDLLIFGALEKKLILSRCRSIGDSCLPLLKSNESLHKAKFKLIIKLILAI